MYKIFYNDSVLKIIEQSENQISDAEIDERIHQFIENKNQDITINSLNANYTFSLVQKQFHFIEAAGGLVFNTKNQFLYIQRLGIPDLPKGKKEKGETPEMTALREVTEECGISELKIIKTLEPSFHIYFEKKWILKKTYWFEMVYENNKLPVPQTEEQITKVEFISISEASFLMEKTYPNLKNLFAYAANRK
jgi:8-oxo-dGTP pyrophosphatase MutT (NUDIX family)